jgi:catechol 2,3-dioxygenase-like lactoylglutathione lyase family enzyme
MTSTRDVILRTNDLAGAKAHYHGKLGFATVADAERLVGFDTGSFILYFELGEANGPVFDFEAENMDEMKQLLLAQGCSVVEENAAVPRCYLRDPFGLVFNLAQR